MLGAWNTCVRLQSKVTGSGATVDSLFFVVCLFACFLSSCCLFFFFVIFIYFFIGDEVGSKDWVFHRGWGMGVVALITKNMGVSEGVDHYNLCWPEYWGSFLIWLGVGRCEVATSWCEKINWVVIRIKLCWSDYDLMLSIGL